MCSIPTSQKLNKEVTTAVSISAAMILVQCIGRHSTSSDLTNFPLYCFYIWWSERTTSCTCLTVQLSTTQLMLQPCGILVGTSSNQYTTPSTHRIKTHHIIASSITLHRLTNFNSQDFNYDPFLTYIYITHITLTEIIIIFNCYGVTMAQLTTLVPLYSCNNITLKMVMIAAETRGWENFE